MPLKKYAEVVARAVTAFLMMAMVILTLLQVVTRYVFETPLPWTEELARLDLIYLTFIGSIVAFQRREHLRVDVLVQALPLRVRKWLGVIVDLASILVLGVVVWQGVPLLRKFWPILSAALLWPTTVFYFPVIFSCFVMVVYTALDILAVIRGPGDEVEIDVVRETPR